MKAKQNLKRVRAVALRVKDPASLYQFAQSSAVGKGSPVAAAVAWITAAAWVSFLAQTLHMREEKKKSKQSKLPCNLHTFSFIETREGPASLL